MSHPVLLYKLSSDTSFVDIFSRSEFKISASVSGFSTTRKRLVSLANSLMFEPISFNVSFIYRRNSSGPRRIPCGTPA